MILALFSVAFSQPGIGFSGYLREVEASICMDECGQYYIDNIVDFDPIPVIIPDTFDRAVGDRMIQVDVVKGYDVSNELAKNGIFVGQSSGAYLLGAKQVAEEIKSGQVVTIFNDIGERYFSTSMWG